MSGTAASRDTPAVVKDRQFALRMIPYGVFVATAVHPGRREAAGVTVHWVTQTAFEPCMLAVSMPASHPALGLIRETQRFALHMLGKEDKSVALSFGRDPSLVRVPFEGAMEAGTARLGGYPCSWGRHGTLLLSHGVAVVECAMRAVLEAGDHFPVIGEVLATHVRLPKQKRPEDMQLHLRELGETIFHGG